MKVYTIDEDSLHDLLDYAAQFGPKIMDLDPITPEEYEAGLEEAIEALVLISEETSSPAEEVMLEVFNVLANLKLAGMLDGVIVGDEPDEISVALDSGVSPVAGITVNEDGSWTSEDPDEDAMLQSLHATIQQITGVHL